VEKAFKLLVSTEQQVGRREDGGVVRTRDAWSAPESALHRAMDRSSASDAGLREGGRQAASSCLQGSQKVPPLLPGGRSQVGFGSPRVNPLASTGAPLPRGHGEQREESLPPGGCPWPHTGAS
jgi:hypothetical protein